MPTLLQKIQELIPKDAFVSEKDLEEDEEMLMDIMSAIDNDDANEPKKARENLDLYVSKLGEKSENGDSKELNEFTNKLLALCGEYARAIRELPDKLSSSALGISAEKDAFKAANGEAFYMYVVMMLQTAMAERYVAEKLNGQEVKSVADNKDAVYACLYDGHSSMYALSENKDLNFQAELDEFSLQIKTRTKHVSVDDINDLKEETPAVKIFKTNITPAELKEACARVKKTPDYQLITQANGQVTKEPFGWGRKVWQSESKKEDLEKKQEARDVPAHRNCHAFVYTAMQETFRKRLQLEQATKLASAGSQQDIISRAKPKK